MERHGFGLDGSRGFATSLWNMAVGWTLWFWFVPPRPT